MVEFSFESSSPAENAARLFPYLHVSGVSDSVGGFCAVETFHLEFRCEGISLPQCVHQLSLSHSLALSLIRNSVIKTFSPFFIF